MTSGTLEASVYGNKRWRETGLIEARLIDQKVAYDIPIIFNDVDCLERGAGAKAAPN
jgi:hypothetical protein